MCYRWLHIEQAASEESAMADIGIEREVDIDAPVDVVWRTITEPDQIVQWFAERVELDLVPGGQGHMRFDEEHGSPIVVEAVEPPTRFSFRWNHPPDEKPVPGNSVLVEFTLTASGPERTHLRVVESGHELLGWADAEKERYAREHNGGWGGYLARLAELCARGRME
jgi:uncharacterized protein YndB with AHSA1/START domain